MFQKKIQDCLATLNILLPDSVLFTIKGFKAGVQCDSVSF